MTDPHKNVGIRITSDPDTTRMTEPGADRTPREAPLPLRLLLVADLTPEARPSWRQDALVQRVDAHRFAEVMEAAAPTLRLDVPNRLAPQPASLEIALQFRSLKDFTPQGVAAQVPALARLLAIRTEVHGVRSKGTDRETFRDRLAEAGVDAASADALYGQLTAPPPKPKPARDPDDPLDRLMGMVDSGDGAPGDGADEPAGLAGALADAISGDAPRIARSAADEIVDDFDRKLGGQIRAVLEHPAFRRLEAAWRGLKFLVDRLPPRQPVLLDVLPAPREALDEALYHQVLVPEHEAGDEAVPLAAVLLGFAFDNGQADVAALEELAETGASLQAPIVASASPAFFGLGGPEDEAPLPFVPQLVQGPGYIHWAKLREREDARFVALAYPPFLLRAPYGPDNPAKAFPLEEEGHLWGGAALAVGAAIVDSFAETGWPTHLAGRTVTDLPLRETGRGRTPLAALLPEDKAAELADAGFAVLTGEPNRDALRVAHAPNLARPQTFDDPEKTAHAAAHATLGCGLFTARAAYRMLALPAELDPADSVEAKREQIVRRLRAFLSDAPEDAVSAEPVPDAEIEGHDLFAVRMQPPRSVLAHPIHLAVGLPIPKAG